MEEFINWSQGEHKKEFEGKVVAERIKILERLINGELESLDNGPGAEALNDWIAELYEAPRASPRYHIFGRIRRSISSFALRATEDPPDIHPRVNPWYSAEADKMGY